MLDLAIIGGGPAGISAALEAQRSGLDYVVLEKGLIANTIYQYPIGLTVFSTPDELEFEKAALKPVASKPTREELLSYYVRTVREGGLNFRTECNVSGVRSLNGGGFELTVGADLMQARNIIFAIGAMEYPRRLGVPGEDLPKVQHLFRETYPFVGKNVMVIGGGNSAGEAALFLAQEGANTTLAIFRADWENEDPKQGCIKYWVKRPLEDELSRECLTVFFLKNVLEISGDSILLESEDGENVRFDNDAVFVLIGSDADLSVLESLGVGFEESKYGKVPAYDENTFETEVKGIFVAGHFTKSRHIAGAISAPRSIIPIIAARCGK